MAEGGEVSGRLPPQAGRIIGSRIAMVSGTHGELASGGAEAMLVGRAATRSVPASSDIPRDRNVHEVQGAFVFFLVSSLSFKIFSPAPLKRIKNLVLQPAGLKPQKDFLCY